MAAAVCRGLGSWLDPGFRHKHDPIPSSLNCGFLEAISTKDDDVRWPDHRDDLYIHPLVVGAPSMRLSQKSLELCTEKLGNETGSDVSDNESAVSGVFSSSMAEEGCLSKRLHGRARKAERYAGFPPPLTTIEGPGDLRYKMRREQGRLVVVAVRTSSAVFRVERSRGRLTLSFIDEPAGISRHYEEEDREYRNPGSVEETEGDEDNAEAVEGCTFKRPSGCKDSDHRLQHHEKRGLSSWETFLVATS